MQDSVDYSSSYSRLVSKRLAWIFVALVALLLSTFTDILTGPALLGFDQVLGALFSTDKSDPTTTIIVWTIRLPMTLMAMLVGAALGIAGVAMQTILGNPLASPYTLGFSAAAGFGAAMAILTGITLPVFPWLTIPAAAFVAASLATLLVYGLARRKGMTADVMVLAGIATLFLFQSLQSMVQYLASPEVLQAIVFWLFGSLLKANWSNVPITASILILCVTLLVPDLWKMTALRLGDARASSLGIDVERLRFKVFVIVALLTAGAVAFVGTIGFVGLVAPHIARMLVGDDQRFLMPMAAITGAFIVTGASVLSKVVSPGSVIPIGIVTAVIGVPFLFGLILFGKGRIR